MTSKLTYTDVVHNAFKAVQAWKTAAVFLIGVLVFETFALIWVAADRTVILVPQGMAEATKPIALSLRAPYSPDYLTQAAHGDLSLLLNWTPENIDLQYGRFLSRASPALHAAQKESLVAEAKQHKEDGLTQSFYPTRTYVKEAAVTIYGILVRSAGGREVFRGPAAYQVDYESAGNGYLWVTAVSQPDNHPVQAGAQPAAAQ